jgi:EF-P beta-lysylation protein EpmB
MSPPLWRKIQKTNFTKVDDLCEFLELSTYQAQRVLKQSPFPLNLPRRLAEKIGKGTLEDPILKQFLPLNEEESKTDGFGHNPVGDCEATKESGFIRKYHNRALIITTSACAMHCRYCFRRHYPYESGVKNFEKILEKINESPELNEIILSGGDPLSLNNETLSDLLNKVAQTKHIKRVRFHTRFPIGIPERIDGSFLSILENSPLQLYFVIHCNHPKELDQTVLHHIQKVGRLGIPLLNQSVLLKGVNNSCEVLAELSEKLSDNGIIPYYLHQLDRVDGGAHFEVPIQEGLKIMEKLSKKLSGYSLPQYVQERAGVPYKVPLHSLNSLES